MDFYTRQTKAINKLLGLPDSEEKDTLLDLVTDIQVWGDALVTVVETIELL